MQIDAEMSSNRTFLPVPEASDFPIDNLPFGVFSRAGQLGQPRVGVALGSNVIDLWELQAAGLFSGPELSGTRCFQQARQKGTTSEIFPPLTSP